MKAVVAESFERIHRSNLIGSCLPLQFQDDTRESLGLQGDETFDIKGIDGDITPRQDIMMTVHYPSGESKEVTLMCRTLDEAITTAMVEYCISFFGILPRQLSRLSGQCRDEASVFFSKRCSLYHSVLNTKSSFGFNRYMILAR